MKRRHTLTFGIVGVVVFILSLILFKTVLAASKNYHNLTTVTYNNTMNQSQFGWNPGYSDSTSPSLSMSQFGYSYWHSWQTCNGYEKEGTNYESSNSYLNNYSSIGNARAVSKKQCDQGIPMVGHNYVMHYWQYSNYNGDGGNILSPDYTLSPP